MQNETPNSPIDQSRSEEFLLAEFGALQDRVISLEEIKSTRVNFLLIVLGATIAAFSGLADVQSVSEFYRILVIIGAFANFVLGISTLKNTIDYSIVIVILLRRAGRIRRWFVDNDSNISQYIAFEANDDRPRMYVGKSLLTWRGGEPILFISNVLAASAVVGLGLSYISRFWSIVGVALTIVVVWSLQFLYVIRRLDKQERNEKRRVNFPSVEKPE